MGWGAAVASQARRAAADLTATSADPMQLSGERRLRAVAAHLRPPSPAIAESAPTASGIVAGASTTEGAAATKSRTPTMASCGVFPTADPAAAFDDLRRVGVCVLSGVLFEEEMEQLRARLLAVAAQPEHSAAVSGRGAPGLSSAEVRRPASEAARWSPGDDVRAHPGGHIPSFVRHDPRWAELSVRPPVAALVERVFGDEWKVIYTTATVNQAGYRGVEWHSDGHLTQAGAFIDAMPRLVALFMLSPFTASRTIIAQTCAALSEVSQQLIIARTGRQRRDLDSPSITPRRHGTGALLVRGGAGLAAGGRGPHHRPGRLRLLLRLPHLP